MVEQVTYDYTDLNREQIIEAMHFHQKKATELLILLNESPSIKVGEIPAPLWTPHSTGHDQQ